MPSPTSSPLSDEQVREYEQMLVAVTPGPWKVAREARQWLPGWQEAHGEPPASVEIETVQIDAQLHSPYPIVGLASGAYCRPRIAITDADAEFIAASPTIVAALLADRSRLSARVEELERRLGQEGAK